jgi:ribonuclease HI
MNPDFIIFVDGGCTSNPGNLAVGVVVCSPDHQIIVENARAVGSGTNNVAEYRALEHGICMANLIGAQRPLFCTDSDLVVKQVNHLWAMKGNDELKDAHARCTSALMNFSRWTVKHIPRERNRRADWLVTKFLGHSRALKSPPDITPVESNSDGRPGWRELA